MNRESESNLLEFCVRQHADFRDKDWLAYSHPDKDELAAACLFLACQDWYGHHEELEDVAERLRPGTHGDIEALIRTTDFNCLRFSTMLRRELLHALSPS